MNAQAWLELLRRNGFRLTEARRAVVELVADSKHALTPLEMYDIARRKHRTLGLVSVYRALEKLEELSLIQRVHQPQGCQAFIAAGVGHKHLLLCQGCGAVEFFEGDDLAALMRVISRKSGYKIQEHWLQLFGLCSKCRKD